MARTSTLSESEISEIHRLKKEGLSIRAIAEALGISKAKVEAALSRQVEEEQQQRVAALLNTEVAQRTVNTVFNVMDGLEYCLEQTKILLADDNTDAPLKDKVAVRSELRQLFAEARRTLESIYTIRMFDEFIREVAAILEESTPGARKRIFERLEQSASAAGLIGLFARERDPGQADSGPGDEG